MLKVGGAEKTPGELEAKERDLPPDAQKGKEHSSKKKKKKRSSSKDRKKRKHTDVVEDQVSCCFMLFLIIDVIYCNISQTSVSILIGFQNVPEKLSTQDCLPSFTRCY